LAWAKGDSVKKFRETVQNLATPVSAMFFIAVFFYPVYQMTKISKAFTQGEELATQRVMAGLQLPEEKNAAKRVLTATQKGECWINASGALQREQPLLWISEDDKQALAATSHVRLLECYVTELKIKKVLETPTNLDRLLVAAPAVEPTS